MAKKVCSIRLHQEDKERAEELASALGWSFSKLIEHLIRKATIDENDNLGGHPREAVLEEGSQK